MELTRTDKEMRDGKFGRLSAEAMDFLIKFGEAYDARNMIDLDYAYVYLADINIWRKNSNSHDLLEEVKKEKVKCRIPTTSWIVGTEIDRGLYVQNCYPQESIDQIDKETEICRELGIICINTCTPYLVGDMATPALGSHIASIESSAVTYFNSIQGTRCNRDGISAFFASLTGRYPNFGMHLDENRKGKYLFDIKAELNDSADYSALGYYIGKVSGLDVPVLKGLGRPSVEEAQKLCSAMAVGGAVSLAHIIGVTPEAPNEEAAFHGDRPVEIFKVTNKEIETVYDEFHSSVDDIHFVCLGCPHASIHDLKKYAELYDGRRVADNVTVWVMTAPQNIFLAESCGFSRILKNAGVTLLSTCPMVNPGTPGPIHTFTNREYSVGNFATNSMKLVYYARNCMRPGKTFLGRAEKCVESSISGKWL